MYRICYIPEIMRRGLDVVYIKLRSRKEAGENPKLIELVIASKPVQASVPAKEAGPVKHDELAAAWNDPVHKEGDQMFIIRDVFPDHEYAMDLIYNGETYVESQMKSYVKAAADDTRASTSALGA